MIIRVREKQAGGNTFRRGQQGFEMTTDCITAASAKPMTFLDVEQQLEDLLAMERIMHQQAWIAVNEDWIGLFASRCGPNEFNGRRDNTIKNNPSAQSGGFFFSGCGMSATFRVDQALTMKVTMVHGRVEIQNTLRWFVRVFAAQLWRRKPLRTNRNV